MELPTTTLAQTGGLVVIDWLIIFLYAISTLALGWWFGRKQSSSREYFTGSGAMNSVLIGVSLFATLLSTLSYLMIPGEAIGKGPIWMAQLVAYPAIFLVAGFVLLPVYMRHRVTSAYELLEEKLGRGTRLFGASLFILLRLVWMSTLIYAASKALAVIFGLSPQWEPFIVLCAGAVSVGYTSLGGLRAVVITDFMQTILLYGGAVLVISIISVRMGSFAWFPTEWHPDWDHQPLFSLDLSVRATAVGAFLSMLVWNVCTLGGDQVSVQRFMATKDARAARRSLATHLIVGMIVVLTLLLAGFALLGYFEANPAALGDGLSLKEDADKIFPWFIANGLPPVASGLVVAALCAAAMSSVDSGVNSITAVVMSDFLGGSLSDDEKDERRRFRQARILAVIIGAIIIAASSLVKYIPGNLLAITTKTVNLLTAPIFCLFFFALFVKNVKPAAAWLGSVTGIIVAILVAFSGPIFGFEAETGADPVSFMWMAPFSVVANILVGLAACRIFPTPDSPSHQIARFIPAGVMALFIVGLFTAWTPAARIQLDAEDREKCLAVLRQGLRSNEFWPSMHAAEGLTIGGHGDEVRKFLEPRLNDPELDEQQRCGVARELYRAGDRDKEHILFDILSGEDDFAHTHAAESLYKTAGIGDGVAMRRAFSPDRPITLRLMAAGALAKAGDREAMDFLRENLRAEDPETFKIAAWILGRIGGREDIEPIRSRIEDASDPLIRAYLEHSLAALGDPSGLAALGTNLEDDEPDIRTYAATFAGDARAIQVAPKLLKMLDDPDLDARIRAAQSLLDLANHN